MKKCPVCESSKYKNGYCRKCKFRNDPNYLRRKHDNSKPNEKSN